MMHQVASVQFVDAESGEEAGVTVRGGDEGVALAVYLRRNGDILVVMRPEDCDSLAAALQQAAAIARPQGSG